MGRGAPPFAESFTSNLLILNYHTQTKLFLKGQRKDSFISVKTKNKILMFVSKCNSSVMLPEEESVYSIITTTPFLLHWKDKSFPHMKHHYIYPRCPTLNQYKLKYIRNILLVDAIREPDMLMIY